MKKGIIPLFALIISLSFTLKSQIKINQVKNSIHFDVATIYLIGMYSVNYERLIYPWRSLKIYANANYGGWLKIEDLNEDNHLENYDGKSLTLNSIFLIGGRNHHFETSLGVRYIFFDENWEKSHQSIYPEINLGYRFQKFDGKGLLFRFFIGSTGIGVGVGKAF